MSSPIITVENLSKSYLIGHQGPRERYHSLRDTIVRHGKNFARRTVDTLRGKQMLQGDSTEEFWALKDVSFEVKEGEVLGIIGRNGAGKSTLLKILSRITEPTKGRVTLRGRVASLLEVGTGFHPELTGRENIFLNGAILGMSKREIKAKFDEIVDFAGVEKFLDTPVKRYSSGMYVRLAFAVAAHLEPEILIVDEVLAVGDAEFQKKCMGKMQDVAGCGRTVIFVSHNMSAILQLTTRGILMSNGKMIFAGTPTETAERYVNNFNLEKAVIFDVEKTHRKYNGNQAARILSLRFNRNIPIFATDETFEFTIKIKALVYITKIRCSMTIFAADGTPVGSTFGSEVEGIKGNDVAEATIMLKDANLAPGHYYCGVAIGKGNHLTGHIDYDVVLDTLHFEVRAAEGVAGTLSQWSQGWGRIVFKELENEQWNKVS
jgi:lipopolysaccharide transport system ATP-binding protein